MRGKLLSSLIGLVLMASALMVLPVADAGGAALWTEFHGAAPQVQTLPDFVALAARLSPAVVNISAEQKTGDISDPESDPFDRFGRPFEQYGLSHPHSLGSG